MIDITFTDYFRLTKPGETKVTEWKDFVGGGMTSGKGLRVMMEATHAGLVNVNNRFYIPSRMAEGVATFRTGEKPTKIMKHHNPESDPIGVVRGARFVSTIPDDLASNPDVMNLMSSSAPIKTQLKSIRNLWRAGVFERDGWRGLGYIELIADIMDPDSIQQILDGRFDAVSTNFSSPGAAHCLICGKNWAADGFCEHEWGQTYSESEDEEDPFKFPAIPIPGVHKYMEASLIAFAGDALATVRVADSADTSKNKEIFLPDNFKWEEDMNTPQSTFEFKDFKEDTMAQKDNPIVLSDAEQKVLALIKKHREGVDEKALEDFAKKIAAMYDSEGHLPDQLEAELDEETAVLYALEDLETAEASIDDAKVAEIEALYLEEFDKMHTEGVLTDAQLEDAKLSAGKRKSLPKTTFCGPNRSFPVPDCAHVTAARRLIGRYKGPGSKSSILACVSRKAKAMGCGGSDSQQDSAAEPKIPSVLPCQEDSLKTMNDSQLRNLYMAAELELVGRGQKMAFECKECALHTERENKAAEDLAKALDEQKKQAGILAVLREELARLQVEYIAQVDAHVELGATLHALKVEKLALISVLAGKYDNLDKAKEAITSSDMQKTEASLADFDMMAAAAKLNDGMSKEPKGTVKDPTVIVDADNRQLPEGLSGPAKTAIDNIRDLLASKQIREARHIYATMKSLKLFPNDLTFESLSAEVNKTAE
jgi:hypothetical protein